MSTRVLACLLVVAIALSAVASLAGPAQGQAVNQRPARTPPDYEEVEITGGYTHDLLSGEGGGTWLNTARTIQAIDLSDPAAPRIAGRPEHVTPGLIGLTRRAGVAWAYIADELWRRNPVQVSNGYWEQVWDLDEGMPVPAERPAQRFDYVRQIVLPADRPELVLLLTRGGLRVLDIQVADRPEELAYLPRSSEQHNTYEMVYARGRAYFLESGQGRVWIRSFDLSDPARPIEAEPYAVDYESFGLPATSAWAWLLRAEGERIYLAGRERLLLLEAPGATVSGAAVSGSHGSPLPAPRELGSMALDARPWSLLPDGQRLWLVSRPSVLDRSRLRGIDIADPASPRWLSPELTLEPTYRIPPHFSFTSVHHRPGIQMARVGEHLLLSDANGGQLRSVDVSDPAAPFLAGRLDRLGECWATVHVSGWTYCSSADGLIPLADGAGRPVQAQEPGTARESLALSAAVPVEGGVAWLDRETAQLRFYGIEPPALPMLQAALDLPRANHIDAAGSLVYIVIGKAGRQANTDHLLVIDVQDLRQPTIVQRVQLPIEGIVSSAFGDGMLYLSSYDQGILVYDLARPADPRFVSRYDPIPAIRTDIAWHAGSLLVFPNDSTRETSLIVLDTSDPSQLRERKRYALIDFTPVRESEIVFALDDTRGEIYVYVYRAIGPRIVVLDIADPDHIRLVASFEAYGVRDITLRGDRVFVASESLGVSIWERRGGQQPPSLYLPLNLRSPESLAR